LPIPSPSESAWSGFGVLGQLSVASGIVSPSLSMTGSGGVGSSITILLLLFIQTNLESVSEPDGLPLPSLPSLPLSKVLAPTSPSSVAACVSSSVARALRPRDKEKFVLV